MTTDTGEMLFRHVPANKRARLKLFAREMGAVEVEDFNQTVDDLRDQYATLKRVRIGLLNPDTGVVRILPRSFSFDASRTPLQGVDNPNPVTGTEHADGMGYSYTLTQTIVEETKTDPPALRYCCGLPNGRALFVRRLGMTPPDVGALYAHAESNDGPEDVVNPETCEKLATLERFNDIVEVVDNRGPLVIAKLTHRFDPPSFSRILTSFATAADPASSAAVDASFGDRFIPIEPKDGPHGYVLSEVKSS